MNPPANISPARAQQLMSQLMDGELGPVDAAALEAYLAERPDACDWMEGLELARSPLAPPQTRERSLRAIEKAVAQNAQDPEAASSEARGQKGALLRFPKLFRPLAAAAALAVVGSVTWLGLRQDSARPNLEPAVVEFVATDIPDASTYIYSDEESGWTVVWVEPPASDEPRG